jgi:cation diffusion facilitator family transporter
VFRARVKLALGKKAMQAKDRYQQTRHVTLVGVLINTLLGVLKLLIGFFGNSHALIADGVHSFSDLITDFFVLFAAKAGSHGPDKEHPYGHGRIETLAALGLALVLIFVGLGIAFDALSKAINHAPHVPPNISVLIVAGFSIFANEFLFRYTLAFGNRLQSDLLRMNAWHNRSDALSSLVVLVGAFLAILGVRWGDAGAAIIVSLFIINIGVKMLWQNARELIDTGVDEKTKRALVDTIMATDGVKALHQLRTRRLAGRIYLDLHLQVDSNISVSEGHYIADQTMRTLYHQFLQVADVTVHIDPENDEIETSSSKLPDRASVMNLLNQHCADLPHWQECRETRLHYLHDGLGVELFFSETCLPSSENAQAFYQAYSSAINTLCKNASLRIYFNMNS